MIMFSRQAELLFVFMCFHVSYSERRITDGRAVTSDKSYVVYLLKANISTERFEDWLCGGALVTPDFIITAAACIKDVHYIYAIAGYKPLVSDKNINNDDCTRQMKKKITFTCIPVSYDFDHRRLEKWSYIDIALARVETPYDLKDATYQIVCSYIPTTIPINYDPKYQGPGLDAMVLGWGHAENWRAHGDKVSQNMDDLHYTPTLIMDKEQCKVEYEIYPKMVEIIDQFMICTNETGNLDDNGHIIAKITPNTTGCGTKQQLKSGIGIDCELENAKNNRNVQKVREPEEVEEFTRRDGTIISRRSGICQNDHGGPLVTWVGTREVLIGVASVFKVTEDRKCIGPYLYTSTQCNGAFIDCILNHKFQKKGGRRSNESIARAKLCDSPATVRGFEVFENHISWKRHPVERQGRGRKGKRNRPSPQELNDRFSKYNYQGLPAAAYFNNRGQSSLRHRKYKKRRHHRQRHRPKQELVTTSVSNQQLISNQQPQQQVEQQAEVVFARYGKEENEQINGNPPMRLQRPLHEI